MDKDEFIRIERAVQSKHIGWDDIQKLCREVRKLIICQFCDGRLDEPKCTSPGAVYPCGCEIHHD